MEGVKATRVVLGVALVVAIGALAFGLRRGSGSGDAAAGRMLAGLPASYSPAGRYVGPLASNIRPPKIILAADGIPLVKYDVGYRRNPVTTAQYGLWAYGTHHPGVARRAADWLVAHQQPDGRWLYRFDFTLDGQRLKAPWASAMAQGQAMSLLERMYRQTGERRYLTAAVRALRPLSALTTCFRGNCRLPFYEEYPTAKPSDVLNGFMFTLIGLYDLGSVAPGTSAHAMFVDGLRTLHVALPLYDRDGRASYDLASPRIASAGYQAIHVYLLRTLDSSSPDPVLSRYAARWDEQFH